MLSRAALHLLSLALVAVPSRAADTPQLEHGAPWLGHSLPLELSGACAGRTALLLASPLRDDALTPFGLLELERTTAVVLASTTVGRDGRAAFDVSLPHEPGAAESELHLQVLVRDPGLPGGGVLSSAAHLRVVGPRVYAASRGEAGGPPASLAVVSALDGSMVTLLELGPAGPAGPALGDREVLLSSDLDRGAIVGAADRVTLFDPLQGEVLTHVAVVDASATLLRSPEGGRAYVLETGLGGAPARVLALDLEDGSLVQETTLPGTFPGLWVGDGQGRAWLATADGASGRSEVLVLDLATLTVLDRFRVGRPDSVVWRDLALHDGWLLAATETSFVVQDVAAQLTRLPVDGGAAPALEVRPGTWRLSRPTALPEIGRWLVASLTAFLPEGQLLSLPLDGTGQATNLGLPGFALGVLDLAAAGGGAHVLLTSLDGDEPDRVFTLDLGGAPSWELTAHLPCYDGALELESLEDAFARTIAVTQEGCGFPDDPAWLLLIDPDAGTITHRVPIAPDPAGLRAVPVP